MERRNQIGHKGTLKEELAEDVARKLLVGAILGFHYVRLLEHKYFKLTP